jgi:hypothetical protein
MILKLVSVKGDKSAVLVSDLSVSIDGFVPRQDGTPSKASSDDHATPHKALHAVEQLAERVRNVVLEDLKLLLEGQSAMIGSRLLRLESRLVYLSEAVADLQARVPPPPCSAPEHELCDAQVQVDETAITHSPVAAPSEVNDVEPAS